MSWAVQRLSEICEINLGKTPSRSNKSYWDDEKVSSNIWVSIADLTKLDGRYISDSKEYISDKGASLFRPVKAGTLLMSFKLSIGKLAYADCDLYTNEAIVALPIKNKNEINPNFLYYYLQSYDWDKETENDIKLKGKTLNKAKLKEIKVPVPSLSTQQKIVEKLDAIFAQIDKATAAAEANIKNAETLFQSYLAEVFEQGSEGWADSCISDVADLVDSLHKTPKYADDGYPMVRVTDIKSGPLNLSSTKKVDEVTFLEFSKRHKPAIGDIVFSRVGSYGFSSYVDSEDDFCLGQNTVFIVPKINTRFLYYFLNSRSARRQYDSLKDGVTQPTISLKSIKSVKLRVPSQEHQKKIASKLDSMYALKNSLLEFYVKKVEELNSFRTSVLRQAFNGELVKE